jgi:hypothetical protein
MDKLKTVVEDYQNWAGLLTYIDRIETHIKQAHVNVYKAFTETK